MVGVVNLLRINGRFQVPVFATPRPHDRILTMPQKYRLPLIMIALCSLLWVGLQVLANEGRVSHSLEALTLGEDLHRRPFLYWRAWAAGPIPFARGALFAVIITYASWLAVPNLLSTARNKCRTQFWRCLLIGTGSVAGTLLLVRMLFLSEIGTPLAYALIAALELG